jgi:predicted ferric reductase
MLQSQIPWAWYFVRASGLVGFMLLYLSIFLGLSLRIPFLRKIISPIYSVALHCWISLYAMLFALLHGVFMIFDQTYHFTLTDVFLPFVSSYRPGLVAMGIFGLYLMAILGVTSFGKRFISQKLWRIIHFSNILLYVFVLIHAVGLGTDLKNPVFFDIFIWANAFLIFIMLYNLELRIASVLKRKSINNQS